MKRLIKCVGFFILFCVLSACGKVAIDVPYNQPARIKLNLKTNNIAVLPSKSKVNKDQELMGLLASQIEERFLKDDTYKPVDLSSKDIQKKLIEASLTESTGFNDDKLLQLGKQLNVSLLVIPTLTTNFRTTPNVQNRTIHVNTGRFRYIHKDGKKIPIAIQREVNVQDKYETKEININSHVKLVNVETGAIESTFSLRTRPAYLSKILVERGADENAASGLMRGLFDNTPTIHPPEQPFIDNFLGQVTRRTVNEISPVEFNYGAQLYDSGDLEKGLRFAKVGNWEKAADQWSIVLADDAEDYKTLVNLAAAYLALGDIEKSKEYLEQAYQLEDDDDILAFSQMVSVLHKDLQNAKK